MADDDNVVRLDEVRAKIAAQERDEIRAWLEGVVEEHGGRVGHESLMDAFARIHGITTREFMQMLDEECERRGLPK